MEKDKQLSKNFKLSEFLCPCCGKGESGISMWLVSSLQELRNLVGVPVTVLSGYRCPKHNAKVGGGLQSKHLEGIAADIQFPTMFRGQVVNVVDMYLLAEEITKFRFGGMGLYPNRAFIHVDIRPQRTRWVRVQNKQLTLKQYFLGN